MQSRMRAYGSVGARHRRGGRAGGIGLAGILLAAALAAPAAAREDRRAAEIAPLVEATTECFAQHIAASRSARARARGGDWYGAAGAVAPLCRPEVDAMVRRHDALNGFGSGARFFTGRYATTLARTLAARVKLDAVDTADATHASPASQADEPAINGPAPEAIAPEPRS